MRIKRQCSVVQLSLRFLHPAGARDQLASSVRLREGRIAAETARGAARERARRAKEERRPAWRPDAFERFPQRETRLHL